MVAMGGGLVLGHSGLGASKDPSENLILRCHLRVASSFLEHFLIQHSTSHRHLHFIDNSISKDVIPGQGVFQQPSRIGRLFWSFHFGSIHWGMGL